jgi:hypothetical protein
MDLITLKASAYDCLAQIEYLQKQLQEINQKIAEELQKEKNENG